MRNPNPIIEDNVKKYGKPPTWEQVQALISESGITSIYHFERYYGIAFNHLAKVRCGAIQLGRAYWHFFYERIIPERGVGFNTPQNLPKKLTNSIPKVIPTQKNVIIDYHDRTTKLA